MTTRLVLHIDRLVIDGRVSGDRRAVVDALRDELARAFADASAIDRLRASPAHRERMRVPLPIDAGLRGGAFGARIATGLVAGLAGRGGRR